jgi:hypothetical protein
MGGNSGCLEIDKPQNCNWRIGENDDETVDFGLYATF